MIVVNDGSTDQTSVVARKHSATVIDQTPQGGPAAPSAAASTFFAPRISASPLGLLRPVLLLRLGLKR